jgi:argininosuccinate synthase
MHPEEGPVTGRVVVTGRRSTPSLDDFDLATCDTGDMPHPSVSQGFTEIFGTSGMIAARRDLTP